MRAAVAPSIQTPAAPSAPAPEAPKVEAAKPAEAPIIAPNTATAMTATSKTVIPSFSIAPKRSVCYSRPRSEGPLRRARFMGRSGA